VRERSCRKGVESDKAAVRTTAPAKRRCNSCRACKRGFALSIFSPLCVGDGLIDRHRYDALAYCVGMSGLCLPCVLYSDLLVGSRYSPWQQISMPLDAMWSRVVPLGPVDHPASMGDPTEKAGGEAGPDACG